MRNLHLHIFRILLLFLFTGVVAHGQTLEENYNNGSINQRQGNCWEFSNFEINQTNAINTGGGKKHGSTVNMDSYNFWSIGTWVSYSSMSTPFANFDGSGSIVFKHKADVDDYSTLSGGYLTVYLIDPNGNQVSVFNHTYRQPGWTTAQQHPNGPAEITQQETIPITWTGYYKVEWEWSDYGDAATEYYIDDIVIDTSGSTFVESTTVCLDEVVQHTPADAVTDGAPYNFTYSWSWVGKAGGTLVTQTTNDRTAQVDWNVGAGVYRLMAVESYNNRSCTGRTFYIDVTVKEQPNFAISIDTVCEGYQATLTFEGLVGKSPFVMYYNDGTGAKTLTISGNMESTLLTADAVDVKITDLVDANGCHADPALLIAYPINYHPAPNTAPIYHY